MDRQTLRDWVHFNHAGGPDGLSDQPRRSAEQQAAEEEWVEQGAHLDRDGVVRWRPIDL